MFVCGSPQIVVLLIEKMEPSSFCDENELVDFNGYDYNIEEQITSVFPFKNVKE